METQNNQTKVAVFGDLTALFSARTQLDLNISYRVLDEAIRKEAGVEKLASYKWYTLFHPGNKEQNNFISNLRTNYNWEVITKQLFEVRKMQPSSRDYRFDAQIGYNIGEATCEEYDRIIVVSDSLDLLDPMQNATEFVDNVSLLFFQDAMDRRWGKLLKDVKFKFKDLSELMYEQTLVKDEERFEEVAEATL